MKQKHCLGNIIRSTFSRLCFIIFPPKKSKHTLLHCCTSFLWCKVFSLWLKVWVLDYFKTGRAKMFCNLCMVWFSFWQTCNTSWLDVYSVHVCTYYCSLHIIYTWSFYVMKLFSVILISFQFCHWGSCLQVHTLG